MANTTNDPVARVGDRIKFKVATRDNDPVSVRTVNGQYGDTYTVRFRGYPDFIVHRHEVLAIYRAAETIDIRSTVDRSW